jgi:exodeoxyribonuclease VII small subunit
MPSRKKADTDASPATLEDTIAGIETILARMEGEEQPLEQSLKDFEAGITLTRRAQALLREAEQQVQKLTEDADGEPAATPLDDDTDDNADA